MYDKLFSSIHLPVKPAVLANGAAIQLIEEVSADEETAESFFGGYAEGSMLDDLGVEAVVEAGDGVVARK